MDNKHFPPLEPESSMPEHLPEIPERMEPLEDRPVIEELDFSQEIPSGEILPAAIPPEEVILSVESPETKHPEETEMPEAAENPAETENPLETENPVEEEKPRETVDSAIPEIAPVEIAFSTDPIPDLVSREESVPQIPEEENSVSDPAQSVAEEAVPDQEYRDDSPEFEILMQSAVPQTEQPAEAETAVLPKGRPKRKKGEGLLGIPSILATFVWLALIVIIGVTAGRMLWICAADVLAFGREDKVVTVTVYEADTMEDIIDKLHAGGLIRYKSLFSLYADISDAEEDIKPGIYDLNTRYDYHALVNFMAPRSSREVIKLTIPEGYTCRQIFALLEENRICTAVDAAAYAARGELSEYWFLEDLERGTENCLEGYLFPDTYEFYKNSTPREAIERMLDNFEYRFDADMIAQLDSINNKFHADYGIREIVIIASLIEKESAAPGESPAISGVIYNRLFKWGSNPPYLNIDASIVYAQEGNNARIDTKLDHPYNTYLYECLTPGPIANPGLASLKAALKPESHNYYYYVLNPATGMHQFSTTYQEHQGYVQEFNAVPEIEIE